MLFTDKLNISLESLMNGATPINTEYVYENDLMEAVHEAEYDMAMFDYEYAHEYYNAEMVAIEAYNDTSADTALLESQFEIITEGFLGKVWEKIKSFLKMIWNAIVKLVNKLLEFLHLKKKKIEEKEKALAKEEKTFNNPASTQSSSSSSSAKNEPVIEPPRTPDILKPVEQPKNMSQAIQQQEEKKKQKEGHFSQNKKPRAPRKDDKSWTPRGNKGGHGTRSVPLNKVVIQNSYIDIAKAGKNVADIQIDILNYFKGVSNLIKDLFDGKFVNNYVKRLTNSHYGSDKLGKGSTGQYQAPADKMSYDEILRNTIKSKYVMDVSYTNDENNAAEQGLILLVDKEYDLSEASIPIKRTVENELKERNKFISLTEKVINKGKLSEIKRACDDVERSINSITEKSNAARMGTAINKLAYNGFRRAYMTQLHLVRGVAKVTELSERGEREATSQYSKAA